MNFYASSSRALVGTYTRRSSRRAIEADLRARLREIPTHKEPMMDNKTLDRLPPLPEPEDGPMLRNHPYYTAEQMREYAAAALRATTGEGDDTVTALRARADAAYCDYIRQLDRPECRGWEMKVASGKFGSEELRGHVSAGELLGRHRALNEAAAMLAAAPTPPEPLRDAGAVAWAVVSHFDNDKVAVTTIEPTPEARARLAEEVGAYSVRPLVFGDTHPAPAQPVTDAEAKAARKAAIDACVVEGAYFAPETDDEWDAVVRAALTAAREVKS